MRPRPPRSTSGAGRARTDDLLDAIEALSQLSYSPKRVLRSPAGLPRDEAPPDVVRWTPRNRSRESGTVEDRSRCGKGGSDFRAMWRCSGRPSSHAACCRSPSPCPRTGTGAPRDPRRVWAGTARRRPWVIAPPPSYSLPTRKGQAPQDANTPDQHRHRPDRQASEECERTEQDPQGPDDRTNRRTEPNRTATITSNAA